MTTRGDESSSGVCTACDYDLRGLPAGNCPECGTPFDPADPASVNHGRPLGRVARWLLRSVGWPLQVVLLLSAGLLLYATPWPTSFRVGIAEWDVYRPLLNDFRAALDLLPLLPAEEIAFVVGVGLWLAALLLWLTRCLLRLVVIAWLRPVRSVRGRDWRPAALMTALLLFGAAIVIFGWPGRMARWSVAASLPWHQNLPRSLKEDWPRYPYHLSEDDRQVMLRTGLLRLSGTEHRLALLNHLVQLFPERLPPLLIDVLAEPDDPVFHAAAIRLLALHRLPETAALFETFLEHREPAIRAAAADGIGIVHAPAYPIPIAWGWLGGQIATDPKVSIGSVGRAIGNANASIDPTPIPLPEARRQRLLRMMLGGATVEEREAAARALLPWPAVGYQFRYAEWGVWVSDGGRLTLLESLMEEIPPFVHRAGNPLKELQGSDRIRQRTYNIFKPIVHLTTSHPMSVDLDVRIRRGRPLFAYPKPDDFGLMVAPEEGETVSDANSGSGSGWRSVLPRLPETEMAERLDDLREGYPWLSPSHRLYQGFEGHKSLVERQHGRAAGSPEVRQDALVGVGLRWQSLIVSPERLSWMRPPDVGADAKFQWWARLRDVPSSWVSGRGESERFAYYDGPTSLPSPLDVSLEGDTLRFRQAPWPDEEEPVDSGGVFPPHPGGKRPYYERDGIFIRVENGRPRSWRVPPPGEGETVAAPERGGARGDACAADFLDLLRSAGLTEAEARGLLDSWKEHFFHADGVRYLLLLSEADYDAFCPLSVRPAPTATARVGIVLTEFAP